jgi:hypothetical protein
VNIVSLTGRKMTWRTAHALNNHAIIKNYLLEERMIKPELFMEIEKT